MLNGSVPSPDGQSITVLSYCSAEMTTTRLTDVTGTPGASSHKSNIIYVFTSARG